MCSKRAEVTHEALPFEAFADACLHGGVSLFV
jgi:hypothetical protein